MVDGFWLVISVLGLSVFMPLGSGFPIRLFCCGFGGFLVGVFWMVCCLFLGFGVG